MTEVLEREATAPAVKSDTLTGHRSPRMLMRYANLRGSDLAAKLW